jgi:uncharacterized integral membrane protein (TIGR00698 family)
MSFVPSPAVALAVGAVLALTVGNPFPVATRVTAKWLLQLAVVGLGFGIPIAAIAKAGAAGVGYTMAGIALALTLGIILGRVLDVEKQTSFLITAGTSICGGSAIAAVGPAIGASAEAMSVSLATVFVLNAVALYLFPPIGHWLQLSQHQFAIWAAIAIHDTSSVVGAAASYGSSALQEATVLKLARALWIVPLTLAAAAVTRRDRRSTLATAPETATTVQPPYFIALFLLASVLRSFAAPASDASFDRIASWARVALVATLFLIGAGLTRETLTSVGARPLVQGIVLWIAVGSITLFAVTHFITG